MNLTDKNKIMSKQKDNKTAEIKPELYTLLGVVNLCGRTQKTTGKD